MSMRPGLAIVTAVVAACLAAPLQGQTAGTGRLSGRAVTANGDVLPGVTVNLVGSADTTAITDADGRFELEGFVESAKAYTVTVFLAGFQTTTTDGVRIRPGEVTALGDIVLRLGCVESPLYVTRGILDQSLDADLVAHVRVESLSPAREWPGDYGCVIFSEVTASVLNWTSETRSKRIRFLVDRHWAARYQPGDEFVAAFTWDNAAGRHLISPVPDIPVANGIASVVRLSQVENGLPAQMPVNELLELAGRSKDRPLR
jgi:hypothetical protein